MSGNVEVGRALITEHNVDVRAKIRDARLAFGFDSGCTALHAAACFCAGHEATMAEMLLNAGADINHRSKEGL